MNSMISRAYRSASSLHRFLRGLLGGKARPFMTSSPARLLGLFQVSERLLQPIRRAIGHVRPLLTGYYTLSSLFLPPWALPRPLTVMVWPGFPEARSFVTRWRWPSGSPLRRPA